MPWLKIALTDDEQRTVNAERAAHPDEHVRRKMLVLWLLHCGLTREKAAEVAGLGRATVQRYVKAYRDGGLDGLRRWGVTGPISDLAVHADAIRAALTTHPVRTITEAADRGSFAASHSGPGSAGQPGSTGAAGSKPGCVIPVTLGPAAVERVHEVAGTSSRTRRVAP